VHDLYIALAHRWKPGRIFITLTAYFDESGTHGGDGSADHSTSPTLVMAGMMGTANQWMRFEADLAKLRRVYGFKVLHMLDFKKTAARILWLGPRKTSAISEGLERPY
jgi:hypothetical protein